YGCASCLLSNLPADPVSRDRVSSGLRLNARNAKSEIFVQDCKHGNAGWHIGGMTFFDLRAGAISTGLHWKLTAILNVIEPHDPSPIRVILCCPHSRQR